MLFNITDTCQCACYDGTEAGVILYFIPALFRVFSVIGLFWIHPFAVVLMSMLADYVDFPVRLHCANDVFQLYETFDKVGDSVYYVAIICYLLFWRGHLWYWIWIVWAVLYRLVGNILFLATGSQYNLFFVFFPNVGEYLFIVYVFMDYLRVDQRVKDKTWANWVIFASVTAFKIATETGMHLKKHHFPPLMCFHEISQLLLFIYQPILYAFGIAYFFGLLLRPHFIAYEGYIVERGFLGVFESIKGSWSEKQVEEQNHLHL